VLRIHTRNFLDRGADISFLSCFPGEQESLYPPLTYVKPREQQGSMQIDSMQFRVLDVELQR